ncbi:MAG: hypothetical protein NT070_09605 [Cyanobacteria bacterium]|nr:hypothetical protein [Cyanobacteriota bacterium]
MENRPKELLEQVSDRPQPPANTILTRSKRRNPLVGGVRSHYCPVSCRTVWKCPTGQMVL